MNIENNYTRISVVNRSFTKLEHVEILEIDAGLISFEEVHSRKIYEKNLEELLRKYSKFDEIYFIVQNEKVIIREYKNICNLRKRDIKGYINYEIAKDMPVSLSNYVIKYKILERVKDIMTLQVILFPKFIRDICLDIAEQLKIKNKYLNMNFDIVQRLITLKRFNLDCENYFILENLEEQIILNYVENNDIISSKIFAKDRDVEYIKGFLEKDINIFYFGKEDEFLNRLINELNTVDKLELNKKKKFMLINKTVDKTIENYPLETGVLL